jgi:glyoxylase I family protein
MPLNLVGIHHVAIICSDYQRSKRFYTELLGFAIAQETYRESRNSYKLDIQINDSTQIELFSFPEPPPRVNRPEACGLRHLAFGVANLEEAIAHLNANGVQSEAIRLDELTGKRFTFFKDPDGLPLELYEVSAR